MTSCSRQKLNFLICGCQDRQQSEGEFLRKELSKVRKISILDVDRSQSKVARLIS